MNVVWCVGSYIGEVLSSGSAGDFLLLINSQ